MAPGYICQETRNMAIKRSFSVAWEVEDGQYYLYHAISSRQYFSHILTKRLNSWKNFSLALKITVRYIVFAFLVFYFVKYRIEFLSNLLARIYTIILAHYHCYHKMFRRVHQLRALHYRTAFCNISCTCVGPSNLVHCYFH